MLFQKGPPLVIKKILEFLRPSSSVQYRRQMLPILICIPFTSKVGRCCCCVCVYKYLRKYKNMLTRREFKYVQKDIRTVSLGGR